MFHRMDVPPPFEEVFLLPLREATTTFMVCSPLYRRRSANHYERRCSQFQIADIPPNKIAPATMAASIFGTK